MATTRSGLFTLKEFSYRRNVLKLAPDAFVVVNGALTSRVISPLETKTTKDIDVRGGITSINVSAAVSPPGASRASIEVVAPMFKGVHEDYYVSMPNGTRVPFFSPMMEVKIYMKGRYLESEYNYVPRYYPVFWGMITNVQENYSDGNFTLSITCEDFLCWWKYQKITINPSVQDTFFGGAPQVRFPSVFEKMSAWEIIYSLFTDSFFIQHGESGAESYYNFVYPKWSKSAGLPSSVIPTKEYIGPLASLAIDYWNKRFGFGVTNEDNAELIKDQLQGVPLRMYGLQGPVKFETVRNKLLSFLDKKDGLIGEQADRRANLDLDFSLLARVQPYGLFDLFGDGSESTIYSKLEIATAICEKVFMEFFVDTNGEIVFKPPFYNLDVASGNVNYYRVGPEEVINYNSSFDSNSIVNYLTVTGPLYQSLSSLEAIGFHADFDSIKKYGIRSEQVAVPYGMNSKQLKMIAVAEMSRRNGQAYTGSVSIPLRPEMRLGYPVYLEHIDTFYYVTGINHNFSYGSSAVTELSLQFKREKVFDDGNSNLLGSEKGDVLYSCVLRDKEAEIYELIKANKQIKSELDLLSKHSAGIRSGEIKDSTYKYNDIDTYVNNARKQLISEENGVYSGPGMMGIWQVDRANIKKRTEEQIYKAGDGATYTANELVMITDSSVPYTDKLGYRHIGSFPYGANLVLSKDGSMKDMSDFIQSTDHDVDTIINSTGVRDVTSSGVSSVVNQGTSDIVSEEYVSDREGGELATRENTERLEKLYSMESDIKQQQNEQSNPDIYSTDQPKKGAAALLDTEEAVKIMNDINLSSEFPAISGVNQEQSTYSAQ